MEDTNLPVVARRIWNAARVMFFMLRKGIAKRKFMVDLNMMMKRGKIAGKASLHNLMFHLHHHSSASNRRSHGGHLSSSSSSSSSSAAAAPLQDYEFSCSNTPAAFPFRLIAKRNHHSHFFPCAHPPPTDDDDDDTVTSNAVKRVLEMLESDATSPAVSRFLQSPAVRDMVWSEMASPALPGFGRTPMVRQLRITDSPFPLRDVDEDNRVDEAAEEFIVRFYKELRKQNAMDLD